MTRDGLINWKTETIAAVQDQLSDERADELEIRRDVFADLREELEAGIHWVFWETGGIHPNEGPGLGPETS